MNNPLLATKLYMSSSEAGSMERARLFTRLNKGTAPGRKLTLVSAPAGYGKTTLVTSWLNWSDQPFAWVSLDEGDNDPVRFFNYLIAALKSVQCRISPAFEDVLHSSHSPDVKILVSLLANDLATAPNPFILVLDDYHVIRDFFMHEIIQQVLDYLPPAISFVLITREDPPLPLAKWRVSGQLTEIRVADLKFTLNETAAFFQHRGDFNFTVEELTTLLNCTEGWIAGLQLAAISLQGREPKLRGGFIESFNGSHRYITDYLMEEVLRQQDSEVKCFLCQTSILDSFCPALCDAVTGRYGSKKMLTKLWQANLFLISLDDYKVWFRYHHLFADFLKTELTEAERKKLHQRAAVWYEANNFPEEAVKHMLAADDAQEAKSVILRVAHIMFERGQVKTLLDWIEALPGELLFTDDALIICKAGALFQIGRLEEAAQYTLDFKNILTGKISANSRGGLLAIEALLSAMNDDQETLKLAKEALTLIGENDPLLKIFTLNTIGRAQRIKGSMADSSKTFRTALTLAQKTGSPMHTVMTLNELAFNLYIQGNLCEAINLCRQALHADAETKCKLLPYADILYILLGIFNYELNKLDLSRDYLIKGLEASKRLGLYRIIGVIAERALAQGTQVAEILVENNSAVGIRLTNGTEHRADVIVSAADGYSTIFKMLGGKYVDQSIREQYDQWPIFWPVHIISFGIAHKFSNEPPETIILLKEPLNTGGKETFKMYLRIFNYDHSLAPKGKTVVQALLETNFDHWYNLHDNRVLYDNEKIRLANDVLLRLEKLYPGISSLVEMTDVATPYTFWRYTRNYRGAWEGWLPTPEAIRTIIPKNLPGLAHFYMAGQWVQPGGGIPQSIFSGRSLVQSLCEQERETFSTSLP